MRPRRPYVGMVIALGVFLVAVVLVGRFALTERSGVPDIVTERLYDRTQFVAELKSSGFSLGDAAHVRIYKREHKLELWMKTAAGRYALFRDYDICRFSGELGPKLKEGDKQSPEGFYRVSAKQLNPNSRHHLSFNLGFPNAFDSQLGRTGSALMVHGGCSSVGCYAITDQSVDEVYAVVEAALDNGQDAVDVHVFPFKMTATALAAEGGNTWAPFWRNLKAGYDLFEAEGTPPKVGACRGEYRFGQDAEGPECAAIAAWS